MNKVGDSIFSPIKIELESSVLHGSLGSEINRVRTSFLLKSSKANPEFRTKGCDKRLPI